MRARIFFGFAAILSLLVASLGLLGFLLPKPPVLLCSILAVGGIAATGIWLWLLKQQSSP